MTRDTPRIIAHRGFAGVAPENTVGAFRAVADGRHPAAMIELDVVPCADGTPVVFHDDHLDGNDDSRGITDGAGVVWETPLESIRSATVLDSGETVPTLAAALDAVPPTVGVNVELKNPGTTDVLGGESLPATEVAARREVWDPFVERVVDVLDGADNELLVSSFAEAALASVRDVAPELPAAPLVRDAVTDGLAIAERYDCEALHPRLTAVVPADGADCPPPERTTLLDGAADRGCDVNVWTVRTWYEAHRLTAAGVDGLIANYPNLLRWTDGEPTAGRPRSRPDSDSHEGPDD